MRYVQCCDYIGTNRVIEKLIAPITIADKAVESTTVLTYYQQSYHHHNVVLNYAVPTSNFQYKLT
jgi:hypothetical protein